MYFYPGFFLSTIGPRGGRSPTSPPPWVRAWQSLKRNHLHYFDLSKFDENCKWMKLQNLALSPAQKRMQILCVDAAEII